MLLFRVTYLLHRLFSAASPFLRANVTGTSWYGSLAISIFLSLSSISRFLSISVSISLFLSRSGMYFLCRFSMHSKSIGTKITVASLLAISHTHAHTHARTHTHTHTHTRRRGNFLKTHSNKLDPVPQIWLTQIKALCVGSSHGEINNFRNGAVLRNALKRNPFVKSVFLSLLACFHAWNAFSHYFQLSGAHRRIFSRVSHDRFKIPYKPGVKSPKARYRVASEGKNIRFDALECQKRRNYCRFARVNEGFDHWHDAEVYVRVIRTQWTPLQARKRLRVSLWQGFVFSVILYAKTDHFTREIDVSLFLRSSKNLHGCENYVSLEKCSPIHHLSIETLRFVILGGKWADAPWRVHVLSLVFSVGICFQPKMEERLLKHTPPAPRVQILFPAVLTEPMTCAPWFVSKRSVAAIRTPLWCLSASMLCWRQYWSSTSKWKENEI